MAGRATQANFKPLTLRESRSNTVNDAGKPKLGLHALRHAAASLFIEQDWNPMKVQTRLGDSSITMTIDVYGPLFENAEGDVSMFAKLSSTIFSRRNHCGISLPHPPS